MLRIRALAPARLPVKRPAEMLTRSRHLLVPPMNSPLSLQFPKRLAQQPTITPISLPELPVMNSIAPGCVVSMESLPALQDLEIIWRELEEKSECSFFTSWSWIGVWLHHLPKSIKPLLIKANIGARVVGLGILVRGVRQRFGVPFCEAWYLHSTGDKAQDVVMIEHNDFLLDKDATNTARAAMLTYWAEHTGKASELHLPGLIGRGWNPSVTQAVEREDHIRISYGIDLLAVRDKSGDFVSLLSSHARRFIRRSLKEYQKLGEVQVEIATTVEQGLAYLARLSDLHQSRWTALGEPGAFDGEFFKSFHRELVALNLPRNEIQLLRVHAGGRDLGYLYSFVRGKRLYVYQSGFDYGVIEKHGRPGLVTHTLAVEFNARLGFEVYDLMVGESQYKTTLSTVQEQMTWTVLRKPALRFHLEGWVREWRKKRRDAAATQTLEQSSIALDPVEAD